MVSLFQTGPIPDGYRDLTLPEVDDRFFSYRKHLRYAVMLYLFTTVEARLRMLADDVADRRQKPLIGRRFRKLRRERGSKIRLSEDVLDTWAAAYPETAPSVRRFKGTLPLRDWLAHGRYWNPMLSRHDYEVMDVFDIASDLLDAIARAGTVP